MAHAEGSSERSMRDLSRHTQQFREMLQEEFQISRTQTASKVEAQVPTVASTALVQDPTLVKTLLRSNPHDLVKFKLFKRAPSYIPAARIDKRLIRIRNFDRLPIGVWANWVVSHNYFSTMILLFIIVNSLGLGIQNELDRAANWQMFMTFELLDQVSLIVFTLEIILRWLADFEGFWKSGWNVFDFVVTLLSAIPNILALTGSSDDSIAGVASQLRVFRILRSLKMIARLRNLRLIITTILNAFSNMGFILLLLGIITYMFGIFAIHLFEAYTKSRIPGLKYQEKFEDLPQAIISLFQLLTLDQWYLIEADIRRAVNPWISVTFFITWVWVGAFIFRNIFVGVMVRNFQNISQKMIRIDNARRKQKKLEMKQDQIRALLEESPDAAIPENEREWDPNNMQSDTQTGFPDFSGVIAQYDSKAITESHRWTKLMDDSIDSFASLPKEFNWPSDTLFTYLRTLMKMQENSQEFTELQYLAAVALSNLNENATEVTAASHRHG